MTLRNTFLRRKVLPADDGAEGFTLVELLIVIIVIGILAAITLVAYNGVQSRAHDSARAQALQQIEGALAMYYAANGQYPSSVSTSTVINTSWTTTADSSWNNLATALQPYASPLPSDPIATPNANVQSGTGYNFAYFSNPTGAYCGSGANQMYLIVYRLEASTPPQKSGSACTASLALGPYGSSGANVGNYYMISG